MLMFTAIRNTDGAYHRGLTLTRPQPVRSDFTAAAQFVAPRCRQSERQFVGFGLHPRNHAIFLRK